VAQAGRNSSSTEPGKIRLLLADPHRLYAEAIQRLLTSEGIEVVGLCVSGEETLTAIDDLKPTMVLVGIGLPDVSGIDLGKQILELSPETKVVLVTAQNQSLLAREAIDSGLHGYVTRQSSINQLMSSIAAVSEGNIVMPPARSSVECETEQSRKGIHALAAAFQLTPRENEVLQLLHGGASSKEIAKELSLRPNTVRTHVQNVLTKLQVHSRLEAAAVASRHGLVAGSRD